MIVMIGHRYVQASNITNVTSMYVQVYKQYICKLYKKNGLLFCAAVRLVPL